jgi:hypothetical protein
MSARGPDPERRAALLEAARIVARQDARENEAVVLRRLCDPRSGIAEAMVTALLEARREAAIPLVLRCLGEHRAEGQRLLEGLLESELDGLDVRGKIVSVLIDSDDRNEMLGALSAIGWLAPSGGFPGSPAALARVHDLSESPDEPVRILAQAAVTALGAH